MDIDSLSFHSHIGESVPISNPSPITDKSTTQAEEVSTVQTGSKHPKNNGLAVRRRRGAIRRMESAAAQDALNKVLQLLESKDNGSEQARQTAIEKIEEKISSFPPEEDTSSDEPIDSSSIAQQVLSDQIAKLEQNDKGSERARQRAIEALENRIDAFTDEVS